MNGRRLFSLCAVLGLSVAILVGPPAVAGELPTTAAADGAFRCPGDNPAFFEEIRAAGWVGYGETWDFDTCNDGAAIYADGATRARRDMRPRVARRRNAQMLDEQDVLFYSTALPYGAFGSLVAIFGLAWLVSVVQRRKHRPASIVMCAGCQARVPVRPEEGGVFCPKCGTAALLMTDA